MAQPDTVVMYTDGACINNPGRGGYGVVLLCAGRRKELAAGYRRTTNNRMEIMAALAGLRALKYPCNVTIYTDSRYLADAMMLGWVAKWRAKGWRRSATEPVLNSDLWQQLQELCAYHTVSFMWVKGHAGDAENERCDHLSVQAAKGADLLIDEGYERKDDPLPAPAPTLFDE